MLTKPLKQEVTVLGRKMAYVEHGEGEAILFLHGNPTSSFLWRDVMPPLRGAGRLIAPDLIGMGNSEKLSPAGAETYRFATHSRYLSAFIEAVVPQPDGVVLVVHDWGSALGFDWANRHRDRVRGVAYMEAIVRPLMGWAEWSKSAISIFQGLRSQKGEEMIIDRNMFIERILPGSILRKLSDEEMDEYRRPFPTPGDRWPTLTWPREIPIGGQPADVVAIVGDYARWMESNQIPKLFVNADPGAILVGAAREFCRGWFNQKEVTVAGSHFIQEDSGAEIGAAIRQWLSETKLGAIR